MAGDITRLIKKASAKLALAIDASERNVSHAQHSIHQDLFLHPVHALLISNNAL